VVPALPLPRADDEAKVFATGVEAAAIRTHARVDALLTWQAQALARVRDARASGVAERVAGELIGTPILRASQVAKRTT
jgi:hypothetical protein